MFLVQNIKTATYGGYIMFVLNFIINVTLDMSAKVIG